MNGLIYGRYVEAGLWSAVSCGGAVAAVTGLVLMALGTAKTTEALTEMKPAPVVAPVAAAVVAPVEPVPTPVRRR